MYNSTTFPAADLRLPRSQGTAYGSAYVVEFFFIIIGNLVVLAVFGRKSQLRQWKSHWLLINQSVADLLAGIMIGPFWVYYHLASRSYLWEYYTDVYLIIAADMVFFLFASASIFNLLLIALERMYATLWPIKHRALSVRNYRVAIGLVWSLSVLLPCLNAAELINQISLAAFYYTMMSSTSCALLLIVLSYASIWIKLKFFSPLQNNLRAARERKLTASLFLVTAASLMTYLPGSVLSSFVNIPSIGTSVSGYSAIHAMQCSGLLIYANFMINPILYAFRMPRFRQAALRLVCRRHRRESQALPMGDHAQRQREFPLARSSSLQ